MSVQESAKAASSKTANKQDAKWNIGCREVVWLRRSVGDAGPRSGNVGRSASCSSSRSLSGARRNTISTTSWISGMCRTGHVLVSLLFRHQFFIHIAITLRLIEYGFTTYLASDGLMGSKLRRLLVFIRSPTPAAGMDTTAHSCCRLRSVSSSSHFGALFPIVYLAVGQTLLLVRPSIAGRKPFQDFLARRHSIRAAKYCSWSRDRHGRLMVLFARRRNHQRAVRDWILYLGCILAD